MHFQWYPGHMTKAKRMMQENIKLIDLVIELVDARLPVSSRNPDIDELGKNKARLILLNKADLAEEKWNDAWAEYFKKKGYSVVKVNSKRGGGIKSIQGVIQEACKEKIERDRKRGILNRPVRAMVVGIPNVGKSTFINALAGKACAKTGNKPGVTKGKQWIRLNKNVELLDTPGILWPKFEDQTVGLRLAFIGSIKDEILNTEELGGELIRFLVQSYPGVLQEKYDVSESQDIYACLEEIAKNRHCLVRGSEHIISDRNIICHNFLQNTFIDSFIVPAEQHQFFFFCQFFCHSLGKSRSLWRKIHDTRLLFHFFCDRLICLINRFCLHQHTCSASIWIIIHALMFVKRVIPDIDRLNGKQPVVYRSSDDTGTQSLHDHVRK